MKLIAPIYRTIKGHFTRSAKLAVLCLMLVGLNSCEDVIPVDVGTSAPRLVIDASIKWAKGTSGADQRIYLSTTSSFYSNEVPKVSGAVVQINDSQNHVFTFTENPQVPGEYVCVQFNPVIGETYVLTVVYQNQTYHATESMTKVPTLTTVTQDKQGGLLGNDIQVKFFFQDIANEDNSYLYELNTPLQALPILRVNNDRFFANNTMFGLYSDKDLKAGDQLKFTLHGISKRYYDYMAKLLDIAGSAGGSPFQTAPATVRGNIVNQTNQDNYALGYFRLSETDSKTYVVQ